MTARSFIIGLILLIIVGVTIAYTDHAAQLTLPTGANHLPTVVIGIIILFALFINPVIRLVEPRWAFKQGEMVVIWCMLAAGVGVPAFGLMHYLLPFLVGPFYFSSQGGKWSNAFYEQIPDWLVPSKDPNSSVVTLFYEKIKVADDTPFALLRAIPWQAWVPPFIGWGVAFMAFFVMMFCITAIIRKQWVEHERLSFPLAQIPLEISRDPEPGKFFNALFRSPAMWFGAAVPIGFWTLYTIATYVPWFPYINDVNWALHGLFYSMLPGWHGYFGLNMMAIGVAFLLSTEVSLSLWLFHALANVQRITRLKFGVSGEEFQTHQQVGGFVAFAAVALWTMRHHLRNVLRKAFLDAPDVDDSDEGLPYRVAVIGLLASGAVTIGWLWMLGCPPYVSVFFLICGIMVLLVLSRFIAQCGLIFVQTTLPSGPLSIVQGFLGDKLIGPGGLTAVTFYQAPIYGDPREVMLPSLINNTKVAEKRLTMRSLFIAMIIGVVLMYPISYFSQVYTQYKFGVGKDIYAGEYYPKVACDRLATAIETPQPKLNVGWFGTRHMAIGGSLFIIIHFLRSRFHWWFIHPVGILTAQTFPMDCLWLMTFIGWACKALAQKYARGKLMTHVRRVFLGLIIGDAAMAVVRLVLQLAAM